MPNGPGQQNKFKVVIDSLPLGNFSKCEGLKASYDMKSYEEGGQNGFVHQLPGRIKYENITLTRPIDDASKGVAVWFASFRVAVKRSNAQISVMDAAGHEIMNWTLSGVVPVSWSAGGVDVAANSVVTETLVLSHEGFLDVGMAVPSIL
jgi:phage tail-like protein